MINTIPEMTRYANLNSIPAREPSCPFQISVQKVANGFSAEEIVGHTFQNVMSSAVSPNMSITKLRA